MSEGFYCYETSTKDGIDYFIYWQADTNILGVTNLGDNVFEVKLDRRERKKMLRNVAESLVEGKWRNAFLNKAFKLRDVRNESVELFYVVESVEIPRIDDPSVCKTRNILLFKNALQEINSLLNRANLGSSTLSPVQRLPALKNSSSPSKICKTNDPVKETSGLRRKRGSATGLVFSDNED